MAENVWKWLEIAGMAGRGLTLLEMDGNGWKWLEMARWLPLSEGVLGVLTI